MFSLLSLFLGGGLPIFPCGLVEPCGFMAKVTKVDEKASDEEVALIRGLPLDCQRLESN